MSPIGIRIPVEDLTALRELSGRTGESISALIRSGMEQYISGAEHLPKRPPTTSSSFSCPRELYDRFKALAAEANIPVDEAIRIVVHGLTTEPATK